MKSISNTRTKEDEGQELMDNEEEEEFSSRLAEAICLLLNKQQTDIVSLALAEVVARHIARHPPEQRNGVRLGMIEIIDRFVSIIVNEQGHP